MNHDLVKEIVKVQNRANVDVVVLGVIVKSVKAVFDQLLIGKRIKRI